MSSTLSRFRRKDFSCVEPKVERLPEPVRHYTKLAPVLQNREFGGEKTHDPRVAKMN